MDLLAEHLRETLREQRLLVEVVHLVRTCSDGPPPWLLDLVLLGPACGRLDVPAQRRSPSP